MKKALGWRDQDVLANSEFLRLEMAQMWELNNIQTLGPNWQQQLLQQAQAGMPADSPDMGGGGMPPMGGGGAILDTSMGSGQEEPPNAGQPPTPEIVPENPIA